MHLREVKACCTVYARKEKANPRWVEVTHLPAHILASLTLACGPNYAACAIFCTK